MLAIDRGRPRVMNLKQLMQCFIDHRFEVITRRTKYDLEKAEARAHILEGLLIALANLDDVVKVIRASTNREEARTELVARFQLTEIQANAILDMRLYQLTGMEHGKIEAEYEDIKTKIAYLRSLLEDRTKILDVMKDDLKEIRDLYGQDRRTEIVHGEGELNIEDLLADTCWVVTISHTGYIKRVPVETYREQRRGGRGVQGMNTKDEDFVEHVFTASTHDTILFFTDTGRIYWKKTYEIPEAGRTSRGKALVNFLDIGTEEKIADMICTREFSEEEYLILATERGVVKKTQLSAFRNIRAAGIIAISIDEDDRLIGVKLTHGQDEIVLNTEAGMSIRFEESQLRAQGRATRGVRGISLSKKGDKVKSIVVVDHQGTLLAITENGYGKRTKFEDYRFQKRGGKGVIGIRASARNGKVVGAHMVHDGDTMMLVTEGGQMIRTAVDEIRVISRNTQGVRLINLQENDRLVSATVVKPDLDQTDEPSETVLPEIPPPEESLSPDDSEK